MESQRTLQDALRQFTGTEQWFRHALNRRITYTEGVRYFAQHAGGGAYWFIDILATEPAILRQQRTFAVITLAVAERQATITVDDGNGGVVFTRDITYTDCTEGVWKFYMTDNVIMLPSEY